jgi:hypothetical protein
MILLPDCDIINLKKLRFTLSVTNDLAYKNFFSKPPLTQIQSLSTGIFLVDHQFASIQVWRS